MKRILIAVLTAFLLSIFMCMTVHADPTEPPEDVNNPTGGTVVGNPFSPSGSGTVINAATDGDGKEFYTIEAPDKTVFYLVVDRQRNSQNVYLLKAVSAMDLMSLGDAPKNAGSVVSPVTLPPTDSKAEAPAPESQKSGNSNMGTLIIVILLAAVGGGAGWYFKIYKPKQRGGNAEEYEPDIDDEAEYPEDWDEQEETDSEDEYVTDDTLPWDGEESGDEK